MSKKLIALILVVAIAAALFGWWYVSSGPGASDDVTTTIESEDVQNDSEATVTPESTETIVQQPEEAVQTPVAVEQPLSLAPTLTDEEKERIRCSFPPVKLIHTVGENGRVLFIVDCAWGWLYPMTINDRGEVVQLPGRYAQPPQVNVCGYGKRR